MNIPTSHLRNTCNNYNLFIFHAYMIIIYKFISTVGVAGIRVFSLPREIIIRAVSPRKPCTCAVGRRKWPAEQTSNKLVVPTTIRWLLVCACPLLIDRGPFVVRQDHSSAARITLTPQICYIVMIYAYAHVQYSISERAG